MVSGKRAKKHADRIEKETPAMKGSAEDYLEDYLRTGNSRGGLKDCELNSRGSTLEKPGQGLKFAPRLDTSLSEAAQRRAAAASKL
ncbi:hypothetical protein FS842_001842 [Serendipita sp. 407]|nr:hypothetical protein FS842_001842 [Serendipita sp. 407]